MTVNSHLNLWEPKIDWNLFEFRLKFLLGRVLGTGIDIKENIIEEIMSSIQRLVDVEGEWLLLIAHIHLVGMYHVPTHCAKSFVYITSLNPHNPSMR